MIFILFLSGHKCMYVMWMIVKADYRKKEVNSFIRTIFANKMQDSLYTLSSKVVPFYLGKWGPFTCPVYMDIFQVIAPHLPRQV